VITMKAEIISSNSADNVNDRLNEFIKDKKVIDIKFNVSIGDDSRLILFYALVLYEGDKK